MNPTAEWFLKVPFSEKGLLVGDDSFFQIETWLNARILLSSLKYIYVAPRNHSQKNCWRGKKIEKLFSSFKNYCHAKS